MLRRDAHASLELTCNISHIAHQSPSSLLKQVSNKSCVECILLSLPSEYSCLIIFNTEPNGHLSSRTVTYFAGQHSDNSSIIHDAKSTSELRVSGVKVEKGEFWVHVMELRAGTFGSYWRMSNEPALHTSRFEQRELSAFRLRFNMRLPKCILWSGASCHSPFRNWIVSTFQDHISLKETKKKKKKPQRSTPRLTNRCRD